jgi:putative SOS response-associated peptidase YedK
MCGRFVLHTPLSLIAKRYWDYQMATADMVARYNIAPGTQIAAIRQEPSGEPRFDCARWGFRPPWADEKSPTPINARLESLKTSKYFQDAFNHQRCVIPANGWYEWMRTKDGQKRPYYITCPNLERGEVLFFAGLYTPTGEGTATRVAIITEPAAKGIQHIHDRQPTLIHPDSLDQWLTPYKTAEDMKGQIKRTPGDNLAFWPVSTAVNRPDPDNNAASLIEPVS